MTSHTQNCQACKSDVVGELYHLGFSNMWCMYCDSCPQVLLLKNHEILAQNNIAFPTLNPGDDGWENYDRHLIPTYEAIEKLFEPCSCEGNYRAWATPRCPKCNDYLFGVEPDQTKPIDWNHKYVFVTWGSIDDINILKENVT